MGDETRTSDELRTIKLEFALSPTVDVYLIFNGPAPDRKCFAQLRRYIDVVESSFSGDEVRPRTGKALTCEKHPNGSRTSNNRCYECAAEHARQLAASRPKKVNP